MNQNLPKPMIDALGRDAAPAEHPSADLLTAFAENTLQGDENRRITDHLARCTNLWQQQRHRSESRRLPRSLQSAQGGPRDWLGRQRLQWA